MSEDNRSGEDNKNENDDETKDVNEGSENGGEKRDRRRRHVRHNSSNSFFEHVSGSTSGHNYHIHMRRGSLGGLPHKAHNHVHSHSHHHSHPKRTSKQNEQLQLRSLTSNFFGALNQSGVSGASLLGPSHINEEEDHYAYHGTHLIYTYIHHSPRLITPEHLWICGLVYVCICVCLYVRVCLSLSLSVNHKLTQLLIDPYLLLHSYIYIYIYGLPLRLAFQVSA